MILKSGNKTLSLDSPRIMGIMNCNQDSFYAESRSLQMDRIVMKIDQMIDAGADIIDIGGMSTKPGSKLIAASEEISRISGAIQYVRDHHPDIWISVDTVQSAVAAHALDLGADMINDVSGGLMDAAMLNVVGLAEKPFVCTHMQGTPENMQLAPTYVDVLEDIMSFFSERILACQQAGINQLLLDPGFGFGKTLEHNFQLLRRMEQFHSLGFPLLAGFSRKSMIYKTLGGGPEEALNGSTVLHTIGLLKGVSILRVHDVREAREAVVLLERMKRA